MRKLSLFGSRVCSGYLCPAHDILDEEHKRILIDNIDDWHLYITAVIDPDSFIWIVKEINAQLEVDIYGDKPYKKPSIKKALKAALKTHADFFNEKKIPVFNYASPEYNQNKRKFSLNSKKK